MNAPEAGTIKEFLVSEEDTVTVGQEIIRLELGGAPSEGDKKSSKPEPEPSKEESTETKPEPKKEEPKPESKKEPEAPKPAKEKPQSTPSQTESKSTETKSSEATSSGPNRGERRVRTHCTDSERLT